MKIPTAGMSLTISPMKSNSFRFSLMAFMMHETWVDTTESTSIGIRLNSSKQPQAPVWQSPLKIEPSDCTFICSEQSGWEREMREKTKRKRTGARVSDERASRPVPPR